ncbi:MAG: hypothetical protein ICV62_02505 [Cyanobacteria bacterium Co-bin13]|nr:hypothetical protein [Cyanobacteria bacterium Co-bin13]
MGLSDKIQDKTIRENIAADFAKLMDEQVATKNGLSGMALKTAYGIVKGAGAGYIPGAIGRILPDAFAALDPMWNEGLQAGDPVGHLVQNSARTADTLLSVTDARIEKTNNGIVRSSYNKFRKSVKGDIEAAVPGMAKIIDAHVQG